MSGAVQSIRGIHDILPADAALWFTLEAAATEVFAAYGYQQIRLPILERTELFKRAVGEVTDIVEKEMYSFEDRGGDSIALRPEGTAGMDSAELAALVNRDAMIGTGLPLQPGDRP